MRQARLITTCVVIAIAAVSGRASGRYPMYSRYKGAGDPKSAASYRCVK